MCDSEEMFPRLGQMIVDYDPPVKKLSEEFIPHAKVPMLLSRVPCSNCSLLTAYRSTCVTVLGTELYAVIRACRGDFHGGDCIAVLTVLVNFHYCC